MQRFAAPPDALRTWARSRKLIFPTWWYKLHPRGTARFWRTVEMERQSSGIGRSDRDGITYIIRRIANERR